MLDIQNPSDFRKIDNEGKDIEKFTIKEVRLIKSIVFNLPSDNSYLLNIIFGDIFHSYNFSISPEGEILTSISSDISVKVKDYLITITGDNIKIYILPWFNESGHIIQVKFIVESLALSLAKMIFRLLTHAVHVRVLS